MRDRECVYRHTVSGAPASGVADEQDVGEAAVFMLNMFADTTELEPRFRHPLAVHFIGFESLAMPHARLSEEYVWETASA